MGFKDFKRYVMVIGHETLDPGDTARDVASRGIDLDPVAGGDDHPFDDFVEGHQFAEGFLDLVGRKGHFFPYFNGCGLMGEANDDNIHSAKIPYGM
jgi:hypothetical protein